MSIARRFAIVSKKNFREGTAKSFSLKYKGERFQGFVVRRANRYYAYQNLCRHLPVALDPQNKQFFSHDGKSIQCHTHGALYEVETGFCFAGPCEGEKLVSLEIKEEEDRLVIRIPDKIETY